MLKQYSLDFDCRFGEVQDRLDQALVKVLGLSQLPLDLSGADREHRRVVERMFQYANSECDLEAVKYSFQNWVKAAEVEP
jgi:hypothetical protein